MHELPEVMNTYAPRDADDLGRRDLPIGPKSELVQQLRERLGEIGIYCMQLGIDLPFLLTNLPAEPDRQRQKSLVEPAIEKLLDSDEIKLNYLLLAGDVSRLYKAILPDAAEQEFTLPVYLHTLLKERLYEITRKPLPRDLLGAASRLVSNAFTLQPQEERLTLTTRETPGHFEVTQLDLSKLKADLRSGPRHIKAEQLRNDLLARIRRLIQENGSRVTYLERLNKAVDTYNEGSANQAVYLPLVDASARVTALPIQQGTQQEQESRLDAYDDDLLELAYDLDAEEQRHVVEGLTREELAIFDILADSVPLSEGQCTRVKEVARSLLKTLSSKFVLDWSTRDQARSRVEVAIGYELNALQEIYSESERTQKRADILLYI
ncbi:MAG: type I restriction enzyme endonuclease domain-containing protein, partial [Ktedonobacteraceae bacterium]